MGSYQEREKRVSQEVTKRKDGLRQQRQLEIDGILKTYSVKEIIDDMRADLWKEGRLREVIQRDAGGFDYKVGYELVTEIPSVLVHSHPLYHEVWSSRISLGDQEIGGGGYSREFCGREFTAIVGDIEIKLKVIVGKELSSSSKSSQLSGPSGFFIREDKYLYIEEPPFMENDGLIKFWGPYVSDNNVSWFPLLCRKLNGWGISGQLPIEDPPFGNALIKSEPFKNNSFEEAMARSNRNRIDTNNLPYQMRDRVNRIIAKLPYKKITRGNIAETFNDRWRSSLDGRYL